MLNDVDFATSGPVATVLREHPDSGPRAQAHRKFGTHLHPAIGKGEFPFGHDAGRGNGNNRIGAITMRPTPLLLIQRVFYQGAVVAAHDVQTAVGHIGIFFTSHRIILILAVAHIAFFITPFAVVEQTGAVELVGENQFGKALGNRHGFQRAVVIALQAPLCAVVRFQQQSILCRQSVGHCAQLLSGGKYRLAATGQFDLGLDRDFAPPVDRTERTFDRCTLAHLQAHQTVGVARGRVGLAVQGDRLGTGACRQRALNVEPHSQFLVGHGIALLIAHNRLIGNALYSLGTQLDHRKQSHGQYD